MKNIELEKIVYIKLGLTHTPTYVTKGIPFLSVKDISNGAINFDNCKYITKEEYDSLPQGAKPQIGDLLFCRVGTIGKPILVDERTPKFGSFVSLGYFRNKDERMLHLNYLKHWMNSENFMKQVQSNVKGASQINLNTGWLSKFTVPIGNLEDQKYKTRILDKTISIIHNKKQQLQEYDQLIKSRFVELFVDKYEKIQVSTKLRTTSGGTPKSDQSEYYANGTIPWLTSGEVNQGRIEKTEKFITEKGLTNSSAKWIPKKSIVIAMYGATAGKVGIIEMPTTTNQAVCAVLPHDEFIPEYLRFAFEYISDELAGKAVGGGQPNISQAIIKDSLIFNPPLEVQIRFSAFVQHVDKLKFVYLFNNLDILH